MKQQTREYMKGMQVYGFVGNFRGQRDINSYLVNLILQVSTRTFLNQGMYIKIVGKNDHIILDSNSEFLVQINFLENLITNRHELFKSPRGVC